MAGWNRLVVALALSALLSALAGCAPGDPLPVDDADPEPTVVSDVVYGHKLGMALTLDVYRPATPNGAGVIFVNSGGYVSPAMNFATSEGGEAELIPEASMGELRQFAVQRLVENGYTIFNVRHSSSPRFLVPEIVDDVRRAVRYVRSHAAEYDVDPNRLGAWGGSAGGHLALMLGTTAETGPTGADSVSPAPLAAVVAYYAPTEWVSERVAATEWARTNYDSPLEAIFPAVAFPEELDPVMSPANYATFDDAPTLIIHGDQDPLVPVEQGRVMHEALTDAGVASELLVIEGASHGFLGEDAERALDRVLAWFDAHLR